MTKKEKIEKKIILKFIEIETFISELEDIIPLSFDEYKYDHKTKAACERYFEKIIQAMVDLSYLILRSKDISESREVFDVLADEKIISKTLAIRLYDAKGMRNVIAHRYGTIDDELVFRSITEELINDVKEFLECMR